MKIAMPEKVVIGMIIFVIVITVCSEMKRHDEWAKFKVEHDCKLVSSQEGKDFSGLAVTTGGVGMGSGRTSGEETYLCDDGVQYTRRKY